MVLVCYRVVRCGGGTDENRRDEPRQSETVRTERWWGKSERRLGGVSELRLSPPYRPTDHRFSSAQYLLAPNRLRVLVSFLYARYHDPAHVEFLYWRRYKSNVRGLKFPMNFRRSVSRVRARARDKTNNLSLAASGTRLLLPEQLLEE